MKVFGYICLFVGIMLGLTLLGFIFKVISLPFHAVGSIVQSQHDIINKTLNADNEIYNYEWFKQAVEDIQATKNKVDIAKTAVASFEKDAGLRKDWTFEDKTEDSRLRSVYQGLQSALENQVADYNARSKMANRSIFASGVLPNILEFGSGFLK